MEDIGTVAIRTFLAKWLAVIEPDKRWEFTVDITSLLVDTSRSANDKLVDKLKERNLICDHSQTKKT